MLLILAYLLVIASAVGWLWIFALAFGNEEFIWAILCLIFSPLAILYGIMHLDEARIPLLLIAVGIIGRIGLVAFM